MPEIPCQRDIALPAVFSWRVTIAGSHCVIHVCGWLTVRIATQPLMDWLMAQLGPGTDLYHPTSTHLPNSLTNPITLYSMTDNWWPIGTHNGMRTWQWRTGKHCQMPFASLTTPLKLCWRRGICVWNVQLSTLTDTNHVTNHPTALRHGACIDGIHIT